MVQQKANSKARVITLREAEKAAIVSALTQSDGHVCLAAERLEIGKTTLYRKLKEYGVVAKRYHATNRSLSRRHNLR